MSDITTSLREEVTLRAGNRCEYCRLSQVGQEATFHMDHVIPRAVGGPTTANNLQKWLDNVLDAETLAEVGIPTD
jgi:hypothetical protein